MEWFYADSENQQHRVEQADLQTLIESGTVTSTTLVWNESMPNWIPAGEALPEEFEGILSAAPPTLTSAQAKQAITAVSGQIPPAPAADALAICSLVLGILGIISCFPVFSLAAVICGHIGRKRARLETVASSNGGMSLGGLITGYVGLVLFAIVIVFYGAIIFAAIASEGGLS